MPLLAPVTTATGRVLLPPLPAAAGRLLLLPLLAPLAAATGCMFLPLCWVARGRARVWARRRGPRYPFGVSPAEQRAAPGRLPRRTRSRIPRRTGNTPTGYA